jgi:hypothetical protein
MSLTFPLPFYTKYSTGHSSNACGYNIESKVVIYAPNYVLSKYVVIRAMDALSAQTNAFEIQFKPFYTKPEVLRARACQNIMSYAKKCHQRRY